MEPPQRSGAFLAGRRRRFAFPPPLLLAADDGLHLALYPVMPISWRSLHHSSRCGDGVQPPATSPRALPHLSALPSSLSWVVTSPSVAAVALLCDGLQGAATMGTSGRKRPMDQQWEPLARTQSLKNQPRFIDL
uniref:Uncharacterized protein n=1 Tax=Oryza nivara TaxID=4536 RepID=A0A0E0H398_ORYNI